VNKGLPRPVSRADLRTLLDTLPDDLRRAVALGAYAGLRVSEVAALRWEDVDVESRRARILHGKGGKARVVALGSVLIDHLLPDVGGNVVTGTNEAMSAATLQRRINRAMTGPASTRPSIGCDTATAPSPTRRPAISSRSVGRWGIRRRSRRRSMLPRRMMWPTRSLRPLPAERPLA
jgi:hypothetical protein